MGTLEVERKGKWDWDLAEHGHFEAQLGVIDLSSAVGTVQCMSILYCVQYIHGYYDYDYDYDYNNNHISMVYIDHICILVVGVVYCSTSILMALVYRHLYSLMRMAIMACPCLFANGIQGYN